MELSQVYFVYLITKSQTRFLLLICQILMLVNLKDELNADKPHLSKEKKRKENTSQVLL